jgi:SAM-dependent methyltransferase
MATRGTRDHWERVHAGRESSEQSWFEEHAERSLALIRSTGLPPSAPIVDVGGGASTLVDGLLAAGFTDLTVLDLSSHALAAARARLGARAERVTWLHADVLEAPLAPSRFALWHDRAFFHFLVDEPQRRAYVAGLRAALRPGGFALIATFAEDGPTRCSGLPVRRYAPDELHAELGVGFDLVTHERETHTTPAGVEQRFVYVLFRRGAAGGD